MDTRHLNSFIALAEEGQFTAAARRMNIVQSGLSMTIKEMEEELGMQLVDRSGKKIRLTPSGELFLGYARASILSLTDGIQAVRLQDGIVRGRLYLGILQSSTPYVDLPRVLATFRKQYPAVEFGVRSLNTGDIPGLVRSGYVDLSFNAIVGEESWPDIETIPFAEDKLVAICSSMHPLAKSRRMKLRDLCHETFVDLSAERALRKLVDQICLSRNIVRNSVYQVTNVDTLLQFVAAGLGVAIVPLGLAKTHPYAKDLSTITLSADGQSIPDWRVVILTRIQKRGRLHQKSTVDLFLQTLATLRARSRAKPCLRVST